MKAFGIALVIAIIFTVLIGRDIYTEMKHKQEITILINSFTAEQVAREGKTDREWYAKTKDIRYE